MPPTGDDNPFERASPWGRSEQGPMRIKLPSARSSPLPPARPAVTAPKPAFTRPPPGGAAGGIYGGSLIPRPSSRSAGAEPSRSSEPPHEPPIAAQIAPEAGETIAAPDEEARETPRAVPASPRSAPVAPRRAPKISTVASSAPRSAPARAERRRAAPFAIAAAVVVLGVVGAQAFVMLSKPRAPGSTAPTRAPASIATAEPAASRSATIIAPSPVPEATPQSTSRPRSRAAAPLRVARATPEMAATPDAQPSQSAPHIAAPGAPDVRPAPLDLPPAAAPIVLGPAPPPPAAVDPQAPMVTRPPELQ